MAEIDNKIRTPEHHNVDFEQFKYDLFEQNPDGNPIYAYNVLDMVFGKIEEDDIRNPSTGELYTYEDIVKVYEDYNAYWDHKFGNREEKFIKKEDEKISPALFLSQSYWQKRYAIKKGKKENYLFGKNKLEDLEQKLRIFKSRNNL